MHATPLSGQTPAPARPPECGTRSPEPGTRNLEPGTAIALPDLEGIWRFSTLTPVERPADVSGRPFFTDAEAAAFEKRNFTDKTSFRGTGAGLHLIERFTRGDAGTLLYEFTVDDPLTFTKPWTAMLPMTKTGDRIFEYACHEGNHALVDILRGARYQERSGTTNP